VNKVIFLKLGGSLITDKLKPHTAKKKIITRMAFEIYEELKKNPDLKLIIGHGSGSFGHNPANKFKTRDGAYSTVDWKGFHKVWREARALNQIVMDTFLKENLPVISYPPSASLISSAHKIIAWDIRAIQKTVEHGMIPVIYGDVAFDLQTGSTIFSTEELFIYLVKFFRPPMILLAGKEEGVYLDFPDRKHILPEINRTNFDEVATILNGSLNIDVTGGMRSKVYAMWNIITKFPKTTISIFSPSRPGTLKNAIDGKLSGTILKNK
jgi:isopentenyl phosphate kinase